MAKPAKSSKGKAHPLKGVAKSEEHKKKISASLKAHHAGKKKGKGKKGIGATIKKVAKKVVKSLTGRTPGRSMSAKAAQIREAIAKLRLANQKLGDKVKALRAKRAPKNSILLLRAQMAHNGRQINKLREDAKRLKAVKSRLTA